MFYVPFYEMNGNGTAVAGVKHVRLHGVYIVDHRHALLLLSARVFFSCTFWTEKTIHLQMPKSDKR